jgi:hypothetical protein
VATVMLSNSTLDAAKTSRCVQVCLGYSASDRSFALSPALGRAGPPLCSLPAACTRAFLSGQVVQREASAGDLLSLCKGVLLSGASEASAFAEGLCSAFETVRHVELTPGSQVRGLAWVQCEHYVAHT